MEVQFHMKHLEDWWQDRLAEVPTGEAEAGVELLPREGAPQKLPPGKRNGAP